MDTPDNTLDMLLKAEMPTQEEMKQMHENYLNHLRSNPNNLSFWFPKIKDVTGFGIPETTVIPVPDEVIPAFCLEQDGDEEKVARFVHDSVMPIVDAMYGLPFIKNGCYSKKFDFKACCPDDAKEETILKCIKDIQYDALCWKNSAGLSEIVIRERILSPEGAPAIYNGMPLNPEFRLFYDFDQNIPLYVVNYWDRDYCQEAISRNAKDGEAYEKRYPSLLQEYCRAVPYVFKLAIEGLQKVEGLSGIWSVDVMLDSNGVPWLIDMAVAQHSNYWDETKAALCLLIPDTVRWMESIPNRPDRLRDMHRFRLKTWEFLTGQPNCFSVDVQNDVAELYAIEKDGSCDATTGLIRRFIEEKLPDNHRDWLEEHDALIPQLEAEPNPFSPPYDHLHQRLNDLCQAMFVASLNNFLKSKNENQ